MKYAIWKYIQDKMTDLKNSNIQDIPADLDPSIVEINFGLNSYDNLIMVKNIENTTKQIEIQNIIMNKSKSY